MSVQLPGLITWLEVVAMLRLACHVQYTVHSICACCRGVFGLTVGLRCSMLRRSPINKLLHMMGV
jgi:hypothetical protein